MCASDTSSLEDLNTISELSHCFYSSHKSPASICAAEVSTIIKPRTFILIIDPLGAKCWQRIMEMQSPKMPSKHLLIKTNKYNKNNRICFLWYVEKSLING